MLSIKATQLLEQWLRLIAGNQHRPTIASPALQSGVQTAGGCHQRGLAQQLFGVRALVTLLRYNLEREGSG